MGLRAAALVAELTVAKYPNLASAVIGETRTARLRRPRGAIERRVEPPLPPGEHRRGSVPGLSPDPRLRHRPVPDPDRCPYPLTGRFFLTQRRPNRVHVQRIDRRAA